jgi:hypothetical protein
LPKTKATSAVTPLPEVLVGLNVKLEPLEAANTYYANHIEVASTAHDFSLICARLPAKLNAEQLEQAKTENTIVVEPEIQIIIPATLIDGVINALTLQKAVYEKIHDLDISQRGGK